MFFIAGPCVIESEEIVSEIAAAVSEISKNQNVEIYFKASFDKANRTSSKSYRGPGLDKGLQVLSDVKAKYGLKILTDVHEYTPLQRVAEVVDVLQTPAFLVRQTDFIQNVARHAKIINIKKGQFLAPWDMIHVVEKCKEVSDREVWVTERGSSFGYNTLVSDMRSLAWLRETKCKVIFDATHSVQQPGGKGASSGGQREMVPVLARAAAAVGVDGIFMETHPEPEQALSDGPNMVPLRYLETLIKQLDAINKVVSADERLEVVF